MREEVLSLTERLVGMDSSPGSSTRPLIDWLAQQLRALGADVRKQEGEAHGAPQGNLVARFGGSGPAGLVLAGHVDTVPWEPSFRATVHAERDGNRLYGRGTCDMKGAIAAQIRAAASVADQLARPLVLAYTYAEEIGCDGALALVGEKRLLGDLEGASCIVGEPTGLRPMCAHKGYWIARLRLAGVAAHSSDPAAGVDASLALARLLGELHVLRDELRLEGIDSGFQPPETTLNTGLISAGLARNVVPDRAEVTVELRPIPGADAAGLRRRVQACLDRAAASVSGVRGSLEWIETMPAFGQSGEAPVVRWLSETTGHPPARIPFYTEAELYRSGLGVPTVVCGPGSIEQAHRVDESIGFDELLAGVELYRGAVRTFCC